MYESKSNKNPNLMSKTSFKLPTNPVRTISQLPTEETEGQRSQATPQGSGADNGKAKTWTQVFKIKPHNPDLTTLQLQLYDGQLFH